MKTNRWSVLGLCMAAVLMASTGFAQVQPDVLKEIEAMKARVNALEAENAALQGDGDELELDSQISALTDRLMAATTVKSAANPVTMSGEFRFRNSWSFGDGGLLNGFDEHDGSWTDSLVRLGFQYDFTRDVTAFMELQSHWAYGDASSQTNPPVSQTQGREGLTANAYQAWLEIRNLFGRAEFSTRTGRQEIVLGNQFQFGNADWYNGFTFDGTRWDWDSESFSLTGLALKLNSNDGDINQISSFNNNHDDSELYSVYFTLKTIENHELDLYWIYINGHGNGATGTLTNFNNTVDNEYWHTIGGRIGGEFPGVGAGMDWNAELAYQFGDQDTGGADIDAFAAEVEFGITFNKDSMFRAYARMLYAEGPDDGDATYQTLFPNRHSNSGFRARYGIADLQLMTNVFSLQGGIHFDPTADWTLGATVLWAEPDEDAVVTSGGIPAGFIDADDDYGWELDVWAEYRYSENLTFNAGVAFVFPDDTNSGLVTDDDTQFIGYLQARLLF